MDDTLLPTLVALLPELGQMSRKQIAALVGLAPYDIESFFVAITEVSTVAGYLAGCLDNPAHNPRFADIGYYASFGPLCDRYPCHLHINLNERYRNRGIGSALIAAFAAQAANAGRSGIHVVTEERARNVRFYERNEFRPLATAHWNGADVAKGIVSR